MSDSSISNVLKNFFEELSKNPVEERVVNYVVSEIKHGRHMSDVLMDPYVSNRLSPEKIEHMVSHNKELIEAVQSELQKAFKNEEFKFWD